MDEEALAMMDEKGGSRTDTVVKLVLIFFISLLSFSVGTFVGKQVSDSDYRRASLEEDYKDRTTASTDSEANQVGLSDEEIASLTEEFVQNEKNEMAEEKATTESKSAAEVATTEKSQVDGYKPLGKSAKATKPAATEVTAKAEVKAEPKQVAAISKAANRVAAGQAPTPTPQEPRKPTSILPDVASTAVGKYTVQVASYATEEEALKHAADLKAKGFSAFYVSANIKGKTWYRVSVGLFTNQKSAMNFRQELMDQANISSAIIQKIVQ